MPNVYAFGYGAGGYGGGGYGLANEVISADPSRFRGEDPVDTADPTLSHDQDPLDDFTGELVFGGEDPVGAAAPTVKSMPKRKDDEPTVFGIRPA